MVHRAAGRGQYMSGRRGATCDQGQTEEAGNDQSVSQLKLGIMQILHILYSKSDIEIKYPKFNQWTNFINNFVINSLVSLNLILHMLHLNTFKVVFVFYLSHFQETVLINSNMYIFTFDEVTFDVFCSPKHTTSPCLLSSVFPHPHQKLSAKLNLPIVCYTFSLQTTPHHTYTHTPRLT